MKLTALHKTARAYALAGIPIFPCLPGSKKPACPNGYKDATTDPKQVNKWWGEANYNIALCPEDCGWCVIDAEAEAWRTFELRLPGTYAIATPREGRHYYLAGSLPSTVQKLGTKIDTRGIGGYVLLPPSIVGGKPYTLLHDTEIAPVPAWVVDALKPAAKVTEAPDFEPDTPGNLMRAKQYLLNLSPVQEKDGADARTYEAACAIRELGVTESAAVDLMREHYRCEPQDHRYEAFLVRKVHNAYHYAQNVPGVHAAPAAAQVFTHIEIDRPTINGASIVEKDVNWLWHPYLPAGNISLLAGRGGQGKGLVASSIAAAITKGEHWPMSRETAAGGRVLWCEAEDAPSQTLKPRWVAAGVDCSKVELVTPKLFPTLNLKAFIHDNDIRLVVFSPIVSFLKGLQDINAEMGVRAALELIQEAVEDTNCAALGIAHINKKADLDAIDRVLGSVAFTNYVRSVMFVAPDGEDEDKKRLVHAKFNLSKKGADLLYTTESLDATRRGQRVRVSWSRPEGNVDAGAVYDRKKKKAPAVDDAAKWLRAHLAEGPKHSIEVYSAAEHNGHSNYAVRQAIKALGIKADKEGMDGGWIMKLPE